MGLIKKAELRMSTTESTSAEDTGRGSEKKIRTTIRHSRIGKVIRRTMSTLINQILLSRFHILIPPSNTFRFSMPMAMRTPVLFRTGPPVSLPCVAGVFLMMGFPIRNLGPLDLPQFAVPLLFLIIITIVLHLLKVVVAIQVIHQYL